MGGSLIDSPLLSMYGCGDSQLKGSYYDFRLYFRVLGLSMALTRGPSGKERSRNMKNPTIMRFMARSWVTSG